MKTFAFFQLYFFNLVLKNLRHAEGGVAEGKYSLRYQIYLAENLVNQKKE